MSEKTVKLRFKAGGPMGLFVYNTFYNKDGVIGEESEGYARGLIASFPDNFEIVQDAPAPKPEPKAVVSEAEEKAAVGPSENKAAPAPSKSKGYR